MRLRSAPTNIEAGRVTIRKLGVLAGAALTLAASSYGVFALIGSRQEDAERRAVRAYESAVRPLGRRGGQVVVEEIRPAVSDLYYRRMMPEQFQRRAVAWKRVMQEVRRGFAEAPAPPRLRRAAQLFDRALAGYARAIDAFVAASQKRSDWMRSAIRAAAEIADRADETYDRASALLSGELRRLGLPAPREPI